MTLLELYRAFGADNAAGKQARDLLSQTHWLSVNVDFDPRTGNAVAQSLTTFFERIAQQSATVIHRDRLWRVTAHARDAVERLLRGLNESPQREHALLPVHAVRELDASSFIKLSSRPGRNIREKLAGKPYLHAVRRIQSIDLTENRLFKAFVIRLSELLALRRDCLGEPEDPLLTRIESWLRSDEANSIPAWHNLPPNNTLLSHRDYRRVWDAWRWLQTLDEDIARDFSQLARRKTTMSQWKQCAKEWSEGEVQYADMPVLFDFDAFTIQPWTSRLVFQKIQKSPQHQPNQKIRRPAAQRPVNAPACVDLGLARTRFTVSRESGHSLPEHLVWQQWKNDSHSVDITLFRADAVCLHEQATTISAPDLFFAADNTSTAFDSAARAFASRLRTTFRHDTLVWLVPDAINDFGLDTIRRNLNAHFPDARPLPRSVAAIFGRMADVDVRAGQAVVVLDTIGGKCSATKLVARFDPALAKRLPESRGMCWERQPPVDIALPTKPGKASQEHGMIAVDEGKWRFPSSLTTSHPAVTRNALIADPRIGQFSELIVLSASPVDGGIVLHEMQQRAGDIPLWRDQIPELSIKVMKDGRYQRFDLVTHGTTVRPVRGAPVTISVEDTFTLPAEIQSYRFPLFQGERADALGFSARLSSPEFPLKQAAICSLALSFEYGADEPYKLVFEPLDKSFSPVRASWHRNETVIVEDAPAPDYPLPTDWESLRRVPTKDGADVSNLMDWIQKSAHWLRVETFRVTGEITRDWKIDKNGVPYTFAQCDAAGDVFLSAKNLASNLEHSDLARGDEISFRLLKRETRFSALDVTRIDAPRSFKNVAEKIVNRFGFPAIQIWRDGRSLNDLDCPVEFSTTMREHIRYLFDLWDSPGVPADVQNDLSYLLACMHQDAPQEFGEWVVAQCIDQRLSRPRIAGLSLGDVSLPWQRKLLATLLVQSREMDSLRALSCAIWRTEGFADLLPLAELKEIVESLNRALGAKSRHPKIQSELLELLLGLLRTRASSIPEVKMMLQPHQEITKQLARHLERITEDFHKSASAPFSRLKINLEKPKGDRTPDLLYALRLYLTGDDGANAIHVTGIADAEDSA